MVYDIGRKISQYTAKSQGFGSCSCVFPNETNFLVPKWLCGQFIHLPFLQKLLLVKRGVYMCVYNMDILCINSGIFLSASNLPRGAYIIWSPNHPLPDPNDSIKSSLPSTSYFGWVQTHHRKKMKKKTGMTGGWRLRPRFIIFPAVSYNSETVAVSFTTSSMLSCAWDLWNSKQLGFCSGVQHIGALIHCYTVPSPLHQPKPPLQEEGESCKESRKKQQTMCGIEIYDTWIACRMDKNWT